MGHGKKKQSHTDSGLGAVKETREQKRKRLADEAKAREVSKMLSWQSNRVIVIAHVLFMDLSLHLIFIEASYKVSVIALQDDGEN